MWITSGQMSRSGLLKSTFLAFILLQLSVALAQHAAPPATIGTFDYADIKVHYLLYNQEKGKEGLTLI
jgi:hypothetical protein